MALPKHIKVKESMSELKALLKKASPLIAPRIRTIIELFYRSLLWSFHKTPKGVSCL
jgi:hypothetical protein